MSNAATPLIAVVCPGMMVRLRSKFFSHDFIMTHGAGFIINVWEGDELDKMVEIMWSRDGIPRIDLACLSNIEEL